MAQGKSSLLADAGFDSIGAKADKKSKGSKLDGLAIAKLAGGGIALLVGLYLILNSLGVFNQPPKPAPLNEAQIRQEEEKRQEQRKKIELERGGSVGSA